MSTYDRLVYDYDHDRMAPGRATAALIRFAEKVGGGVARRTWVFATYSRGWWYPLACSKRAARKLGATRVVVGA